MGLQAHFLCKALIFSGQTTGKLKIENYLPDSDLDAVMRAKFMIGFLLIAISAMLLVKKMYLTSEVTRRLEIKEGSFLNPSYTQPSSKLLGSQVPFTFMNCRSDNPIAVLGNSQEDEIDTRKANESG